MSFQFVKRHDVRRTDDFWFEIDEYKSASGEQFLLVHLQFFKWTPSVFKQLLREWREFRKHVTAPLFACPPSLDDKRKRFYERTGWRYQQDVVCEDGETRPLYINTV